MDELLAALQQKIPVNSTVFGWSLGGMLALKIAQHHPHKVARIITYATNLSFVQTRDYKYAMPATTFSNFNKLLQKDVSKCLQQFRYACNS